MSTLKAGVARRQLTPPIGTPLMGYGARVGVSQGVHDDLYATTLVFDDGTTRAVLVAIDLIFLHPTTVESIQTQVQAACAIAPEAVFLCCSHTHSGPITYADERSPESHHQLIAGFVAAIVEAVVEASAGLQTATLHIGRAEAAININRREKTPDGRVIIGNNPDGIVDHGVQMLQVRTEIGELLATLVNYACHPVVMGPLNLLVSADWVGQMRACIEDTFGGYCLFIQGCTADLNPRHMRWTDDNWDEVEMQGVAVCQAVMQAAETVHTISAIPIHARQQQHWLRLLPQGDSDVRQFFPEVTSEAEARRKIHDIFPWQVDVERRKDGLYSPVAVGVLQVGEWGLVTLGTEPFVETGLSIKAASPFQMTFVAGYTNGCNSYLPVASAYDEGGYEVDTAPLFYGLPAGFEHGGAELVAEFAVRLLKMLQ